MLKKREIQGEHENSHDILKTIADTHQIAQQQNQFLIQEMMNQQVQAQ